jgi:pimeloyl-ACP methyl ester carboxylesterase
LRAFAHWPGYWSAVNDEVAVWDETMEQMRRAMGHGALQELPLVVLTAPDNPGMEAMREPWLEMQRDLASVSTAATHHVVTGAGHISMATEPEPIRRVIQAVRELI